MAVGVGHAKPCPQCGYCPTCGRSNVRPWPPWQPYQPYRPPWRPWGTFPYQQPISPPYPTVTYGMADSTASDTLATAN